MSELPKGWAEKKIGDIAELINGDRSKNYPSQDEQLDDGFCLFLNTPNVKHGRFNFSNTKFITKEQHESLRNGTLKRDDIVLTIRGTLGNCAVYTDDIEFETVRINSAMMIVRPSVAIHPWYLTRILSSSAFLEWSQRNHRGSAQPHLRASDIKDYPIFFPAVAEQTRIVEKLDEVLAQVDAIKTRLDSIPAILKRFRQSVLAASVSGRLTEEWRKDRRFDSANEFLRITADRSKVVSGKNKQAQAHLKSEEYRIPESWFWVSLDALTRHIVDGTHHTPTYIESGIPFISVKDIKNGVIDFSDTKFISEEEHIELSKRCCVEYGDLLITKSGTIGRTAIVNTDRKFSLFVSVALLKPASSLVNMQFVNVALQKWINEIDVSSRIVGSAIKNLHLRDMRVLAIPFAPLDEQKEIVRLVDQYFAFADTIEVQVKKAQVRVDNLTQSILAKAFRGELVAQDSNDEPAEKLLDRIAQARKEAEALAKAAKKVAKTK